jgi:hypothetical protein
MRHIHYRDSGVCSWDSLSCNIMHSGKRVPTFRSLILHPSSSFLNKFEFLLGSKDKFCISTAVLSKSALLVCIKLEKPSLTSYLCIEVDCERKLPSRILSYFSDMTQANCFSSNAQCLYFPGTPTKKRLLLKVCLHDIYYNTNTQCLLCFKQHIVLFRRIRKLNFYAGCLLAKQAMLMKYVSATSFVKKIYCFVAYYTSHTQYSEFNLSIPYVFMA